MQWKRNENENFITLLIYTLDTIKRKKPVSPNPVNVYAKYCYNHVGNIVPI